jgi:Tol biopolymer transport system component
VFLVLGESRIQVQFTDVTDFGEDLVPVFSPNGRKLAFKAQRPSRRWAIGVIDFDAGPGPVDEASVKWGPEFARGADPPAWSPDSTHVVYAASHSPTEWVVVTGTEPGPSYIDAITNHVVAFRSDGAAAFPASLAGSEPIPNSGQRQ